MYQAFATTLEPVHTKRDTKALAPNIKFKEGNSVLLRDHAVDILHPKYVGDYIIVSFHWKA